MSDPILPFSGLLDALRAKGLPIGVREYVAFAELWRRMEGATAVELRGAAAALLASSPEEVHLVVETFDALYLRTATTRPPPPAPPPWPWWQRGLAALRRSVLVRWSVSVVLVAIAGVALWAWSQRQAALPAMPSVPPYLWSADWRPPTVDRLRPEGGADVVPPETPLPPPPTTFRRAAALATLGLSGVGTLLLWQWPRVRATERRRLRRARRRGQASMPGPTTFTLAPLDPPTWFDRQDLEDAATLLGRAFTTGAAGPRLNPARTVRATLTRGGLPTFVFETSVATGTLLVLEDVSPEMAIWQHKTAALVAALRRQGVTIERWVFDGTPALAGRDVVGERLPLGEVARRVTASGVLVISSGSGLPLETPTEGRDWREALVEFRRRSWLNPVVAPGAWRPGLRALPVNVWPMTGQGLLDAANDLAMDPDGRRRASSDARGAATVLADDIERLKRLIAVAGQPSLELVEVLRQRFVPDAPEDTVLHVLDEAEHGTARAVRLPAAEMRRLLAAERRENPARERAVREYVLSLLAMRPAPAGSVAALRWRLADASHRVALAALDGGDAASARDTLRELAASPIADEVDDAAGVLPGVDPRTVFDAPRWRGMRHAAGGPGALAASNRRGWLLPRPLELAVAALAALGLTAGLRAAGAFTGDAIAHVEGAYALTYSANADANGTAGLLTVARGPNDEVRAPGTLQLFRNGEPFGTPFSLPPDGVFERPLLPADTGHHFQARAVLPQGNLAVSDAVWVPAPRQTLSVSVDAMPWAMVRVLDAAADRPAAQSAYATPAVLHLPAGRYRLEFTHPEFGTVTRDVLVAADASPEVQVVMPGFDAAAVARELVAPARRE